MKLEVDIPSCGHPEQIKELKKLRNQLIELTAWAGWLDGRWEEPADGEAPWRTRAWEDGIGKKYLELAERDLGFKKEDI